MKKVIVTTTINNPTIAIDKFDAMPDWELVVIGDLKTPPGYKLNRGTYWSPEMQEKYDKQLSDAIGWNCIQRRNFGLVIANDMQADVVALIDDDNIPLAHWGHNIMVGKDVEVNYYESTLTAFDPIGATNYPQLWHRGFPLQLLSKRDYSSKSKRIVHCDIQADFWNGDPDIDAICRMEHAPECNFDDQYFPLAANKIAPFNSQNTFISKTVLKDYFLFPHIGRMDDIWAAFYVQAKGFNVVFGKASVYQDRNVHDLVKDMKQEYLGYESNLHLVENLGFDPKSIRAFLPGRSIWAFDLYQKHFQK
jgi:hypothetical protein